MWQRPILLEDSLSGNWGSAYSMSKNECPVTVFPEKKNGPINLSCIKATHTFTSGLPLTHMWHVDFDCPKSFSVPAYNSIVMEHRLIREATWWRELGDAAILSSISTVKFVRATWSLCFSVWIIWILYASLLGRAFCVAHRALLNMEFHWNASLMWLTFSSEVYVFPGDFTCSRLPVVLCLLEPHAFPRRRLTSICIAF
jgi:hypothetical protein